MAKGNRRNLTKTKVNQNVSPKTDDTDTRPNINKGRKVRLKCRNKKQKDLANLINDKEIVIASGPAGTGKSYVSIAKAIELIQSPDNSFKKLVITTPAFEADEKLGFMPGDMKEKMAPYIESSLDIIRKIIGTSLTDKLVEDNQIIIQALGFLRGKTIDNSIVIVEEVQNTSPKQIKTILTRIGDNSKFILSGDVDQSDRYRNYKHSGLYDLINRHKNISEIGFITFEVGDVVRNPIICKILNNYKKDEFNYDPNKKLLTETNVVSEKTIEKPKKTFLSKFLNL